MAAGRAVRAARISLPHSACQVRACHKTGRNLHYPVMDPDIPSPRERSELAKDAPPIAHASFTIGDIVKHRMFDFRGVIFDVDPVFANSDDWYEAIPEDIRPRKDQPFYHLLAENAESSYVAYVSQQNLLHDESEEPVDHPAIPGIFDGIEKGRYTLRPEHRH